MKKTFIPNWYEDRKSDIGNKKIKLCIKIALIVNIILLSLLLNSFNEIKNVEGGIVSENNVISVTKPVIKDTTIIEKYKKISTFFDENNFNYNNIIITKESLEIDIKVNNYEEYINVIRRIEEHYSIKKLSPNTKNEGNFNFKVIL